MKKLNRETRFWLIMTIVMFVVCVLCICKAMEYETSISLLPTTFKGFEGIIEMCGTIKKAEYYRSLQSTLYYMVCLSGLGIIACFWTFISHYNEEYYLEKG